MNRFLPFWSIVVAMILCAMVLLVPGQADIVRVFRGVAVFLLVGFLPGLTWSYVFWPLHSIINVERVFLSVVFSLFLVPLLSFFARFASVPITAVTTTVWTLVAIGGGLGWLYFRPSPGPSIKN